MVPDLGKTLKPFLCLFPAVFWSTRAREEIRKRTNLSQWQDKMIIAVVSRLTPQKGVHLIKHAAYKVGLFRLSNKQWAAVFAAQGFVYAAAAEATHPNQAAAAVASAVAA